MVALFTAGRLVALLSCQNGIHGYVRDNPGIYRQRAIDSLESLSFILAEEWERYDTVHAIMQAGEQAAYQFLYSGK